MKLWLRFAALWISLAVIGLAVGYYVSPSRLTWFSGVLIVLLAGVLLSAPNDCADIFSPSLAVSADFAVCVAASQLTVELSEARVR